MSVPKDLANRNTEKVLLYRTASHILGEAITTQPKEIGPRKKWTHLTQKKLKIFFLPKNKIENETNWQKIFVAALLKMQPESDCDLFDQMSDCREARGIDREYKRGSNTKREERDIELFITLVPKVL